MSPTLYGNLSPTIIYDSTLIFPLQHCLCSINLTLRIVFTSDKFFFDENTKLKQ